MPYAGVPCERVQPMVPEAYICAWPDRHRLALALLGDGKGSRTQFKPGIKDAPGIVGRDFAFVEVETYS